MPCYHPVTLKADPKRLGKTHVVPCGKCIGCKIENSRQKAVRGLHEAAMHQHCCFITLTIRGSTRIQDPDASYPLEVDKREEARELSTAREIAPTMPTAGVAKNHAVGNSRSDSDTPNPEGSLDKRHHQLFMKRLLRELRKAGPIKPIRFMMSGEYGTKKGRLHYHYILFGYDFPDKKYWAKRNGRKTYRSALLEKVWPWGNAEIGQDVNFASIQYVAKYITKVKSGPQAAEHYKGRTPEFFYSSRRPGIGRKWIEKYRTSVYPHDRVIINDKAAKPPRYYDKYLKEKFPDELEAVKEKREQIAKQNSGKDSPYNRRAGEKIAHARLTKRSLE